MDKLQAEAVVQAMLEPDRAAQEELRRMRSVAARRLAEQRLAAEFGLLDCGVGAVVAYFAGRHLAPGVVWGGIAGIVASWAFVFLRRALTTRPTGCDSSYTLVDTLN